SGARGSLKTLERPNISPRFATVPPRPMVCCRPDAISLFGRVPTTISTCEKKRNQEETKEEMMKDGWSNVAQVRRQVSEERDRARVHPLGGARGRDERPSGESMSGRRA